MLDSFAPLGFELLIKQRFLLPLEMTNPHPCYLEPFGNTQGKLRERSFLNSTICIADPGAA